MEKDLRGSPLFEKAAAFFQAVRRPGSRQLSDASELNVAPGGRKAVFTGTVADQLAGTLPTCIGEIDLESGDIRLLTRGPGRDRSAKYSPDGCRVAFLSDRCKSGDYQLYLLDPQTGDVTGAPAVDGWVEHLQWSPDGKQIVLLVAGHGADVAGAHGSIASRKGSDGAPSWMPEVDDGEEGYQWRRAWIYELATDRVCQISEQGLNVWEVAWCGPSALVAIGSAAPGEGYWYAAQLWMLPLLGGRGRTVFEPRHQLGALSCSPDGRWIAVVEAICSDRCIVAGDLWLIEPASGQAQRVDTRGIDIAHVEWRSGHQMLLGGHRSFETVVGVYDVLAAQFIQTWSSESISTAGRYVSVSGLDAKGDFALIGEGFKLFPEFAVVRGGDYRAVRSLDLGYAEQSAAIRSVEQVIWHGCDGLEIHGWLLQPQGSPPFPLVMSVHGGPVWQVRPTCLFRDPALLLLIKQGYAIFMPNPRGSSGRGQSFSAHVLGDMGGADAQDCLRAVEQLIRVGIGDPARIGLIGGSYGGFMSSWLVTQDSRFAAAVALAPINNWITEHLLSNVPHWPKLFLADPLHCAGGQYMQRSPVLHAHKAATPMLTICGALDRTTPPQEAVQFHNALRERDVTSVLVTYPEEGHGIRKFPALIDYTARVMAWFMEHMPSQARPAAPTE